MESGDANFLLELSRTESVENNSDLDTPANMNEGHHEKNNASFRDSINNIYGSESQNTLKYVKMKRRHLLQFTTFKQAQGNKVI